MRSIANFGGQDIAKLYGSAAYRTGRWLSDDQMQLQLHGFVPAASVPVTNPPHSSTSIFQRVNIVIDLFRTGLLIRFLLSVTGFFLIDLAGIP